MANTVRKEDIKKAVLEVCAVRLFLGNPPFICSYCLVLLMKGGIPRKGLIAHWQNSDASSLVNMVSTFLSNMFQILFITFSTIEPLYVRNRWKLNISTEARVLKFREVSLWMSLGCVDHTCTCACMHTRTHACTHMHTCTHTRTQTRTLAHTHIHTYTHACMHAHMYTH